MEGVDKTLFAILFPFETHHRPIHVFVFVTVTTKVGTPAASYVPVDHMEDFYYLSFVTIYSLFFLVKSFGSDKTMNLITTG